MIGKGNEELQFEATHNESIPNMEHIFLFQNQIGLPIYDLFHIILNFQLISMISIYNSSLFLIISFVGHCAIIKFKVYRLEKMSHKFQCF